MNQVHRHWMVDFSCQEDLTTSAGEKGDKCFCSGELRTSDVTDERGDDLNWLVDFGCQTELVVVGGELCEICDTGPKRSSHSNSNSGGDPTAKWLLSTITKVISAFVTKDRPAQRCQRSEGELAEFGVYERVFLRAARSTPNASNEESQSKQPIKEAELSNVSDQITNETLQIENQGTEAETLGDIKEEIPSNLEESSGPEQPDENPEIVKSVQDQVEPADADSEPAICEVRRPDSVDANSCANLEAPDGDQELDPDMHSYDRDEYDEAGPSNGRNSSFEHTSYERRPSNGRNSSYENNSYERRPSNGRNASYENSSYQPGTPNGRNSSYENKSYSQDETHHSETSAPFETKTNEVDRCADAATDSKKGLVEIEPAVDRVSSVDVGVGTEPQSGSGLGVGGSIGNGIGWMGRNFTISNIKAAVVDAPKNCVRDVWKSGWPGNTQYPREPKPDDPTRSDSAAFHRAYYNKYKSLVKFDGAVKYLERCKPGRLSGEKLRAMSSVDEMLSDPIRKETYERYGPTGLYFADQFGEENINTYFTLSTLCCKALMIGCGIVTCGYLCCCCFCFCCNFCCGSYKHVVEEEPTPGFYNIYKFDNGESAMDTFPSVVTNQPPSNEKVASP